MKKVFSHVILALLCIPFIYLLMYVMSPIYALIYELRKNTFVAFIVTVFSGIPLAVLILFLSLKVHINEERIIEIPDSGLVLICFSMFVIIFVLIVSWWGIFTAKTALLWDTTPPGQKVQHLMHLQTSFVASWIFIRLALYGKKASSEKISKIPAFLFIACTLIIIITLLLLIT